MPLATALCRLTEVYTELVPEQVRSYLSARRGPHFLATVIERPTSAMAISRCTPTA
jgi:hypothetical protein